MNPHLLHAAQYAFACIGCGLLFLAAINTFSDRFKVSTGLGLAGIACLSAGFAIAGWLA